MCEVRRALERRTLRFGRRLGTVKFGGYVRNWWSASPLTMGMRIRDRRTRYLADEIQHRVVKRVLAAVSGIGHHYGRTEELVL